MNVLIVGCGKVGMRLAKILVEDGHDVSVIDDHEENLKRLGSDFPGNITLGTSIDQDTLKKAGIENCDALAALCPEDNVNIMVAQIAKEIFGVENVLTRIYDPQQEEIYSRLGLQTFCPTNLNAAAALDILVEKQTAQKVKFGSHAVQFYEVEAPKQVWECDVSLVDLSERHFLFGVLQQDGEMHILKGQKLTIHKGDTLLIGMNVD